MHAAGPPTARDAHATPDIAPVAPGQRLAVVDTLRGLAVFGILLVNMALFSMPFYALWLDTRWWTSTPDHLATWAIRLLAEGKFYTLFSFLFGLGMALQMQRIEARGGRFVGLYVRRLVVLLIIGLCHMIFFWWGDILTIYALLGLLLLLFRKRATKTVLIWAVVVYCLAVVPEARWVVQFEPTQLDPETGAELPRDLGAEERYWLAAAEESAAVYAGGTFTEIMAERVRDCDRSSYTLPFMVPGIFAMFLLGLCAGRGRVLHDPAAHQHLLRRLVIWGLPLGVLCNLGYTASFELSSPLAPTWITVGGFALYLVGAPLLSFGYAAGITLLVRHDRWRRRLAPLAAVGRMALSNYLLQTLICTTLFYGYGFGWFGRVGPAVGLLLSVVIYSLQIPLSAWWLRHFRFGPMEWLWRTLTYLKWQPLRVRPVGLPPPTQGLID